MSQVFCFVGGEALEVALAREPRQRQRAKRPLGAESKVQLFCANLPWGMDDAGLNAIFADSGDLEECVVVKKPDGRSRGFGFAKFVNEADATAAIAALDGYVMNAGTENERPLRLQFARELLEPAPAAASASSSAPSRRSRRERKPRPDPGTVPNQIYCSNLPADFRASHLKSMFAEYTVEGTPYISRKKGPRTRYGFIVLSTPAEVEAALKDMNGAEFTSEGDEEPWELKLEKAPPRQAAAARPAPVDDTPRRVYVKGFPPGFNKDDLVELFQDYGEVQSVKLHKKGKRGGPFAHLVFKTREEAVEAVAQRNNHEVDTEEVDEDGSKFVLVVEESRPRTRTGGGGGRRRRGGGGASADAAADAGGDAGGAVAATAAAAADTE
jgi:RNA recognition motif-containing protein